MPKYRYRLVPIPSEDWLEDWSEPYEAEDDDGHRVGVTAKSYYRGMLLARSLWDDAPSADDLALANDVKARIRTLAKLGCDRGRLHAWLQWLARPASSPTKKEIVDAAEVMQSASKCALTLQLSALHWQVDPDGHLNGLWNVLGVYADRLRLLAPSAGLRDPVEENLVRATLVRHVKQQTGKWCDEDVAWLIEMVTGQECATEAHIKWRQRHKALLAKATPMEKAWLYVVRPSWTLRRRFVETLSSEWPRDAASVDSRASVAAACAA